MEYGKLRKPIQLLKASSLSRELHLHFFGAL